MEAATIKRGAVKEAIKGIDLDLERERAVLAEREQALEQQKTVIAKLEYAKRILRGEVTDDSKPKPKPKRKPRKRASSSAANNGQTTRKIEPPSSRARNTGDTEAVAARFIEILRAAPTNGMRRSQLAARADMTGRGKHMVVGAALRVMEANELVLVANGKTDDPLYALTHKGRVEAKSE